MKKATVFGNDKKKVGGTEYCYGIDLGTTNSAISIAIPGDVPRMLAMPNGRATIPSCILWKGGDEFVVGEQAYTHRFEENAAYSAKRDMGTNQKKILRYKGEEREMMPYEISAEVLKGLVKKAESTTDYVGIKNVVITVPSYFGVNEMRDTNKAAELAGLKVLKLTKEPTAAALWYTRNSKLNNKQNILVYDLGGGTFDTSLLSITKNDSEDVEGKGYTFKVLAVDGDPHLGGDDIDIYVYNLIMKDLANQGVPVQNISTQQKEQLLLVISVAKEADKFTTTTKIEIDGKEYEVKFSNADVFEATQFVFRKTESIIDKILAKKKAKVIDQVVTVGGVTKSKVLIKMLEDKFGRVNHSMNPDESVALGASIEASNIFYKLKDLVIKDVVPTSFSVGLQGGILSIIIPEGTTIPTRKVEFFTVQDSKADGVFIEVYQGNTQYKAEATHIGTLAVKGLGSEPEKDKVGVMFKVDSSGILEVVGNVAHGKASAKFINVFNLEDNKNKEMSVAKSRSIARWRVIEDGLEAGDLKDKISALINKYEMAEESELKGIAAELAPLLRQAKPIKIEEMREADLGE